MEEGYINIGGMFCFLICKMTTRNEISVERLNGDVETVKDFVINAVNASDGSDMTSHKNKNWMDEISRMRRSFVWKKVFVKLKRENVTSLCKIGKTICKRNMVLREREVELLKRTERDMIRAMCRVKLID